MKVLLIHNNYQTRGGEDSVFLNEIELLRNKGVSVDVCEFTNDLVSGFFKKTQTFLGVVFSWGSYQQIRCAIAEYSPDVVHVHNYFPLISPSVFYACKKAGVPVVHTLHNYRAICPSALLMYEGKIEERSIHGSPWWAVPKKVYRDSFAGTFVLACMVAFHRKFGTWKGKVDRYIALTNFAKDKYIEAGWPEEKIVVKPNFCHDPFNGHYSAQEKQQRIIYVGRLSEEKGIDTLLSAWEDLDYPLVIVGDGPQRELVESCSNSNVTYLGRKSLDDVMQLVRESSALIMASRWYEGFPMVLVEAMANGTCAIVPKLGGMQEVVVDGMTGLHFKPGDSHDLTEKVRWLISNPEDVKKMGYNARQEYESNYTAEKSYKMLIKIYQDVVDK